MPPPPAAVQRWPSLFETSSPLDIAQFDDCVNCMNTDPNLFDLADGTLRYFSEELEDSFLRIDGVLKHSNSPQSQHIALGVLNTAICKKWHTLSKDQQIGIRNFLGDFVMTVGTNSVAINHHRYLVNKAISTLVSVAKFEWPDRWPGFVDEVLSITSPQALAALNSREEVMNRYHAALLICKILMEEVFIFGDKTMTARWANRKKKALAGELKKIFDVCFDVISSQNQGHDVVIIGRALETLAVLLPSLDPDVTINDQRFPALVHEFLPQMIYEPHLCVDALKCLNEFAVLCGRGLEANQRQIFEEELFGATSSSSTASKNSISNNRSSYNNQQQQMNSDLPPLSPNRRAAVTHAKTICESFWKTLYNCKTTLEMYNGGRGGNNNSEEEIDVESRMITVMETNERFERLFQTLALYCTTIVQYFLQPLLSNESTSSELYSTAAIDWMMKMFLALSYSNSSSSKESRKIAVDFWWHLGELLVKKKSSLARDLIQEMLEDIRLALIRNMAKPEEVTIFEDEDGELQQQVMADVESVELYDKMRQTLVFFAHVDPDGIQSNVMELLRRLLDGTDTWSWSSLNCLCWSFGAMSGALRYDEEKTFFIEFVRGLLKMCEGMSGKDNRAVIASDVMYVLSQYPQFLQAHPRFMRVVLGKLRDFFKEPFPGIKEMAVDTMLKIMSSCASRLWTAFENSNNNNNNASLPPMPLSISLIQRAEENCIELNDQERYIFYESLGFLCATAPTRADAEKGVAVLLDRPNDIIRSATTAVQQNNDLLLQYMNRDIENNNINNTSSDQSNGIGYDDLRSLVHALRLCSRVAKTCGPCFMSEMSDVVFPCMSTMMPLFSQRMASAVASRGADFLGHTGMRVLRQVKREFLKITEHFVANTDDTEFLAQNIFPHVFGFLLTDYEQGHPASREPAVLSLVTAVVKRSQSSLNTYVKNIFECLFMTTVELIADRPEDFPEHRINFFKMIDALCTFCFEAFIEQVATDTNRSPIMEGIFWALKHTEPATSKIGCSTLCTLLNKIGGHHQSWTFCERYLENILNETFSIVVDRLHQQGFREQCAVLQRLFALVQFHAGVPERQPAVTTIFNNLVNKLCQLDGMEQNQTERFVTECMNRCQPVDVQSNVNVPESFCSVIADFLIEVKVWNAETENQFLNDIERQDLERNLEGMQRPATATAGGRLMITAGNNNNNNNNNKFEF